MFVFMYVYQLAHAYVALGAGVELIKPFESF